MDFMKHYSLKFENIKKIINNHKPVIVEIGAHYGEDTLRFLETFPDARIFCFEPDKRNIKIFKKLVNKPGVELIEKAVSNKNGQTKFYPSFVNSNIDSVPEKYNFISKDEYINLGLNGSGASSIKQGFPECLNEDYLVTAIRFDKWYDNKNIGLIDFVWIDVQGAEREVILGMGNVIKKIRMIWMEYGETNYNGAMNREETVSLLNSKGFSLDSHSSDSGLQGDLLFRNKEIFGIH